MTDKLDPEWQRLATEAGHAFAPPLRALVDGASAIAGAHVVGTVAVLVVQVDRNSREKMIRAAATGCRCPECLQAVLRAVCDAYGVQAELSVEGQPMAVH